MRMLENTTISHHPTDVDSNLVPTNQCREPITPHRRPLKVGGCVFGPQYNVGHGVCYLARIVVEHWYSMYLRRLYVDDVDDTCRAGHEELYVV